MVSRLGILGAKSVMPSLWVPCVQSIDAIFSITNGSVYRALVVESSGNHMKL